MPHVIMHILGEGHSRRVHSVTVLQPSILPLMNDDSYGKQFVAQKMFSLLGMRFARYQENPRKLFFLVAAKKKYDGKKDGEIK